MRSPAAAIKLMRVSFTIDVHSRALHLILLFFEKIIEDHKAGKATEDLVVFLREAYKETLEPYHGWMAQQLFNVRAGLPPRL